MCSQILKLETDCLALQPLTKEYCGQFLDYRSNQENSKYQSWVPTSQEDVRAFIDRQPGYFNQPDTWYQIALLEKATGTLAGDIGVHFIAEKMGEVELGCTLSPSFQRRGYAAEALTALINHLFDSCDKYRMIASTDPRNVASIALLQVLGFSQDAHVKNSLYIRGQWVDDLRFSSQIKDWKNRAVD